MGRERDNSRCGEPTNVKGGGRQGAALSQAAAECLKRGPGGRRVSWEIVRLLNLYVLVAIGLHREKQKKAGWKQQPVDHGHRGL